MSQNGPTQPSIERPWPPNGGGDAALDTVIDTAKGPAAQAKSNGVERASSYLRSRKVGELVDALESFGRREPALLLGASFGLGLLAGRFMKSSKSSLATRKAGQAEQVTAKLGGTRDDSSGHDDAKGEGDTNPLPASKEPHASSRPFEPTTPIVHATEPAKSKPESHAALPPLKAPSTRPLSAFARAGTTPSKLPDVLAAVPETPATVDVSPSFLSTSPFASTPTASEPAASPSKKDDSGDTEAPR